MVAFGNPVQGIIRPPGSASIVGNFRVSCSFACHEARTPPKQGIDVSDATCGKPVVAMKAGAISLIIPGKVGSTNLADASIVRVDHGVLADGNDYESGYAHLKIKAGLALGQRVAEGDVLGTIDKIGTSACHLHGGMKVNGVEIDWWPLLRQNGATEDDVLQGSNPVAVSNRRGSVLGDNTRFRSSPFVRTDNILVEYDAGAQLDPDYIVEGTLALGTNKWYGAWGNTPAGKEFGYLNVNAMSPLVPIEQSGHSDAELAKAAADAAIAVASAAVTEAKKYPG